MRASCKILVGTMTGTAEIVAEELRDGLKAEGHAAEIQPMDRLRAEAFAPGGLYLICTSTYGQGDVPDNARDFFEALQRERPDLSQVCFGVFGLGDTTYADTFCFGPKQFVGLLTELGATLLGQPYYHDASSGTLPEEEAVGWLRVWLEAVPEPLRQAA
jgi:MioC protein